MFNFDKSVLGKYDLSLHTSCDNICTPCRHKAKCFNYGMKHDKKLKKMASDFNKLFEEYVEGDTESIIGKFEHLTDKEKLGGLFDSMEDFDDIMDTTEKLMKQYKDDPLLKMCEQYRIKSQEWFVSQNDIIQNRQLRMNKNFQKGLISLQAMESEFTIVNDAIAIAGEFGKALEDSMSNVLFYAYGLKDGKTEMKKDALISAKSLLRGLKKNRSSIKTFINCFEIKNTENLEFVKVLDDIEKGVSELTPNAEKYIRPSFDDWKTPENN